MRAHIADGLGQEQKAKGMHYQNLETLMISGRMHLAKGPIALLMIEDEVEISRPV